MREERGKFVGDVVVNEPYTLWGSIGGNVRVVDDGKLYVRGAIYGNLTAEDGGRVHVFGNVQGDVTVCEGAKVIISGIIGRHVVNSGGRLFIDMDATVMGEVRAKCGETKDERKPKR